MSDPVAAHCPTCGAPVAVLVNEHDRVSYLPALEPLVMPEDDHLLTKGQTRRLLLGLRVEVDRLRLLLAAELGVLSTGKVRKRLGVDYVTMRAYRDAHMERLKADMEPPAAETETPR